MVPQEFAMRRMVLLLALPLMLALAGCHVVGPERFVVFYEPQSSDLDAQGQKVIATVAERARQRPGTPVIVSGFADPEGPVADARRLAARRSLAVAKALVAAGVDPTQIERRAMGGVDYSMDSIESRRVEITLGEK
jgi:outer membrane protein OmpA-like peptidoglycan-associated protein